tara:strand:+ start:1017 stop:1226 length:210 start_codon:yes stop_codon:yes gene_type:complete
MDDLKEDLLDTIAVLKNKLSKLGFAPWLFSVALFLLWPFFYLLMAFSFVKLVLSFSGTAFLAYLCYKKK